MPGINVGMLLCFKAKKEDCVCSHSFTELTVNLAAMSETCFHPFTTPITINTKSFTL